MTATPSSELQLAVVGLWHLGSVYASGFAKLGFSTIAIDENEAVIQRFEQGFAPVFEPGLEETIQEGKQRKRLRFSSRFEEARNADVVLIAYDTPLKADQTPDAEFVLKRVETLLPHLKKDAVVVMCSQLPAGSTRSLEERARSLGVSVQFAAWPENLRLGKAFETFFHPDRIVIGVRDASSRERIARLLAPIDAPVDWVGVESAEMIKHGINAYLALCIAYTNELATICESVGADTREVERGLRSDSRIGPKAYVKAGQAYAGGTLARDIATLDKLWKRCSSSQSLFHAVDQSNERHKEWLQRKITQAFSGKFQGKTVALLGLTYKEGTDTLRGSEAVALGTWLAQSGARVVAFDSAVKKLPSELAELIELRESLAQAVEGSSLAVVSHASQHFHPLLSESHYLKMSSPAIIDASGSLLSLLRSHLGAVAYSSVGYDHSVKL